MGKDIKEPCMCWHCKNRNSCEAYVEHGYKDDSYCRLLYCQAFKREFNKKTEWIPVKFNGEIAGFVQIVTCGSVETVVTDNKILVLPKKIDGEE